VPEFVAVGFEAKQGMIGASSRLLGIVTYGGSLGVTIDHQDHRIDIQYQTLSRFG
jgi:hypothetical protein